MQCLGIHEFPLSLSVLSIINFYLEILLMLFIQQTFAEFLSHTRHHAKSLETTRTKMKRLPSRSL